MTGRLRAPSYKGLREASPRKSAAEEPVELDTEIRKGKRVLKLSNPTSLSARRGVIKGDLLAYYRDSRRRRPAFEGQAFHDEALPGRGVRQSLLPEGRAEAQARLDQDDRDHGLDREKPRERRKIKRAPLVNDELALLWMVNMGCIDLNTWYSRVDKPSRPDWVLFDLDPSDDVGFAETVQVALLVKQALDAVGLESHAKTSGSDGIHVLVPIARRHTYDETREFAEIIASALARTHRGLVTTEWVRRKRQGVLIDSNQNGEGKTIASVYSVRPKPGAPVSTPLRWDNQEWARPEVLHDGLVRDRNSDSDRFEPVLHGRQSLTAALKTVRASRGS